MSLPPVTVHIKRKATDEPVDFLRVHESNGKRQRRATDFVFTRQHAPEANNNLHIPTRAPEGLRPIKDIRRAASSQGLGNSYTQPSPVSLVVQNGNTPSTSAVKPNTTSNTITNVTLEDDPAIKEALQNARQRRFHISRSTPLTISQSPLLNDKIRKKGQPTVFIERRPQRLTSGDRPVQQETLLVADPISAPQEQPRPQKKPGIVKRDIPSKASPPAQPTPSQPVRNVRIPSAIHSPWDVNSTQLIAELQAFTLAEIGHSLAESDASSKPLTIKHEEAILTNKPPRKESRFKPKAPALRYSERHPSSSPSPKPSSSMDLDEPSILSDKSMLDNEVYDGGTEEGDYIIDTYIRVPADVLDSSTEAPEAKNIGLLILESQPDIEEFYGEDDGSESEEGDEADEDENAEDYYTADYPDEEVASDDEYGYNAYRYRNRNADDLEEYGEDDDEDGEYLGGYEIGRGKYVDVGVDG